MNIAKQVLFGLASLGAIAGCGPGTTTSTTDDLATSSTADLETSTTGDMSTPVANTFDVMVGPNSTLTFSPNSATIHVGDSVRWTFASDGHNVVSGTGGTADDKFCYPNNANCETAPLAAVGTIYVHVFPTAGTFPYFCKPHSSLGMTGTVTVQ